MRSSSRAQIYENIFRIKVPQGLGVGVAHHLLKFKVIRSYEYFLYLSTRRPSGRVALFLHKIHITSQGGLHIDH